MQSPTLSFSVDAVWAFDHVTCDDDGKTPLDITGATVTFSLMDRSGQDLMPPQRLFPRNPAKGLSRLIIGPADREANIKPQKARFRISVTFADGVISDQTIGDFEIYDALRPAA